MKKQSKRSQAFFIVGPVDEGWTTVGMDNIVYITQLLSTDNPVKKAMEVDLSGVCGETIFVLPTYEECENLEICLKYLISSAIIRARLENKEVNSELIAWLESWLMLYICKVWCCNGNCDDSKAAQLCFSELLGVIEQNWANKVSYSTLQMAAAILLSLFGWSAGEIGVNKLTEISSRFLAVTA